MNEKFLGKLEKKKLKFLKSYSDTLLSDFFV